MTMTPDDVAAQALDAIGWEGNFGDMEDGTREAQVLVRAYRNCLMQLLRCCHWAFARKRAPMTLLADSTGQTPTVGTIVPDPRFVYSYAYPIDCCKARFVPWHNNNNQATSIPTGNYAINVSVPQMTGLGQPPWTGVQERCARWIEATDFNYPPQQGQIEWEVQGVSPQGRTVILTNVKNAYLVYTALMLYPSTWDSLFRAALVAYLASEVALPLTKDKKFGIEIRREQIAIAKQKIMEARATDGNEGISNSDIPINWMRFRNSGGYGGGRGYGSWGDGGGYGNEYAGHDMIAFGDGSVF